MVTTWLLDERWTAWLSNVPWGAGSLGQPRHSVLAGAQKPGSIYRIAGRSHHIIYLLSTDHVWDMFRRIFFSVLIIMEAGAGKESNDFWQSLQEATEPAFHTCSAPVASRKGWWEVALWGLTQLHPEVTSSTFTNLSLMLLTGTGALMLLFAGQCFEACWKGREIRWGNRKNKY